MSIIGNFAGTYDPAKVIATFGGVTLSGFTDGDFIRIKYKDARYKMVEGIDGEVGRVRNPSMAGIIEVVLSSTSKANVDLSNIVNEIGVGKAVPFLLTDLSGESWVTASKAWIANAPESIFGKTVTERTWIIECADLEKQDAGVNNNSIFDYVLSLF
jgi:hypothetical protein